MIFVNPNILTDIDVNIFPMLSLDHNFLIADVFERIMYLSFFLCNLIRTNLYVSCIFSLFISFILNIMYFENTF